MKLHEIFEDAISVDLCIKKLKEEWPTISEKTDIKKIKDLPHVKEIRAWGSLEDGVIEEFITKVHKDEFYYHTTDLSKHGIIRFGYNEEIDVLYFSKSILNLKDQLRRANEIQKETNNSRSDPVHWK